MSWALEQAADLLRKAEARVAEGRHDVAAAMLVRAFDVVEPLAESDPKAAEMRLRAAALHYDAARRTNAPDAFVERAARVAAGLAGHAVAPAMVRWLAVDLDRRDRPAAEIYLAYVEAGRPLDRLTYERVIRALASTLRIGSRSDPEEVRDRVPLIERLAASRPSLDFPHAYLGRFRYAEGDFRDARKHLMALRGPLRDSAKILNMLGRCAEKLGRLDEAVGFYEKSLRARDAQPIVHFRLGRALIRQLEAAAP